MKNNADPETTGLPMSRISPGSFPTLTRNNFPNPLIARLRTGSHVNQKFFSRTSTPPERSASSILTDHSSITPIDLIGPDRPQTLEPQDQSTSDRFLKSLPPSLFFVSSCLCVRFTNTFSLQKNTLPTSARRHAVPPANAAFRGCGQCVFL